MKLLVFILCLFITGPHLINAQDSVILQKISRSQYQLGDQVGKLHEFSDYFLADPQKKNVFNRFNLARKSQRRFNKIAGVIGIGTVVLAGIIGIENSESSPTVAMVGLFGLTAAVNVSLIGTLFTIPRKTRYKRQLLQQEELSNWHPVINPDYNFSLGVNEYGFGLKLIF